MRSDRYYVQYIHCGWQAVKSVFPGASSETYTPTSMDLAHRRLTLDFTF